MQDDSFETVKEEVKIIENAETANGKDLDPLLTPLDSKSVVQVLKDKIDAFVAATGHYNGSKKQLQHIMIALAMHPFMEEPPVFGYPEAQKVYDLGVQVLSDKLMFLHLGIKEQELAKTIRESTPETIENKEVENGSKEN